MNKIKQFFIRLFDLDVPDKVWLMQEMLAPGGNHIIKMWRQGYFEKNVEFLEDYR